MEGDEVLGDFLKRKKYFFSGRLSQKSSIHIHTWIYIICLDIICLDIICLDIIYV